MRLRGPFIVLLATLLGAIGVSVGAGWFGLHQLESAHRHLVRHDVRRILVLTGMRRLFRTELVLREDLGRAAGDEPRDAVRGRLSEIKAQRRALIAEYRALALPGQHELLQHLEAFDQLEDLRADEEREWEPVVGQLIAETEAHLVASSGEAAEAGGTARTTLAGVSFFAVVVSLLLGSTVLRRIRDTSRELASSEERLREVVASAPSVLAILSPGGALEFVSPQAERLLGFAPAALAQDPFCWVSAADRERLRAAFAQAAGGSAPSPVEVGGVRADGSAWAAAVGCAVSRGPKGVAGVLFQIQDISERAAAERTRARLEQQLGQAQKMEAIGQLAGGVAHDFNNLLTAITGYGELARESLPAGSKTREMLDEVVDAGNRAAALTRQLLAFSRKQVIDPKPVQINAILRDTQRMLGRLLGENVRIECRPAPDLAACRADASQVEQILLNLTINARDAMPQGGAIVIETRNAVLDEAYVAAHPEATPGAYVELSVSDTGCGMTREVLSRVFEPFFTTKPMGQGTGLGLAMVYGAVKQHRGSIDVESEPGRGTTFRVFLPQAESAVEPAGPAPAFHQSLEGCESILLVEDDEHVRRFAAVSLTRCGYRVLEFACAEQALEGLGEFAEELDLVITDLILPGMNGRQLADELSRRGLRLPVLFSSGYSDELVSAAGKLEAGIDLLGKPYSPETLLRRVRAALDRESSRA